DAPVRLGEPPADGLAVVTRLHGHLDLIVLPHIPEIHGAPQLAAVRVDPLALQPGEEFDLNVAEYPLPDVARGRRARPPRDLRGRPASGGVGAGADGPPDVVAT